MEPDKFFLTLSIACFLLAQFFYSLYVTTNYYANSKTYPIYIQDCATTCYGLSLLLFVVAVILYNKNNK